MAKDYYPLRAHVPRGHPIVHAASIVRNREFMMTNCGLTAGFSGYEEVERSSIVTCIKCVALKP